LSALFYPSGYDYGRRQGIYFPALSFAQGIAAESPVFGAERQICAQIPYLMLYF
jgi:hypothetical protein